MRDGTPHLASALGDGQETRVPASLLRLAVACAVFCAATGVRAQSTGAEPLPTGPSAIPDGSAFETVPAAPTPLEDAAPSNGARVEPSVAQRLTGGSTAVMAGAAVLTLTHAAALAATALVAAPLVALAVVSATEGNPWFAAPFFAVLVPFQGGALVAAGSVAALLGVPLVGWVLSRLSAWRVPLAPLLAVWGGVLLAGVVPAVLTALAGALFTVTTTVLGTLVYAAYLEESEGQNPLTADRHAKTQGAPWLFLGSLVVTQLAVAGVVGVAHSVALAALGAWAARYGRATNARDPSWEPDVLPTE